MKKAACFAGIVVLIGCAIDVRATTFTDAGAVNAYVGSGQAFGGRLSVVSPYGSGFTASGYTSANGVYSAQGGYIAGTQVADFTFQLFLTPTGAASPEVISFSALNPAIGSTDYFKVAGLGSQFQGSSSGLNTQFNFGFRDGMGILNIQESNGVLSYWVRSLYGDFTLDGAVFKVNTTKIAVQGVPDSGSTAILMLAALGSLALLTRRTSSASA